MEDQKDSLTFEFGKWKASASGRFAIVALILFVGSVVLGSALAGTNQIAHWSGADRQISDK
ncbi:hypothetical protein [Rhizobium sp. SYY.PMSO]|uniref:hypothetical protein n=1 Tax=Rhizobium sp. SYY.PMSO TaxID=3382192 RepID=UPI0039900AC1